MPTPRPLLLALALATSVALPLTLAQAQGAPAQRARETVSGRDVAIYNIAGRVRLERGTGEDVTVEIIRGGRDADRLRIATSVVRGRNALRVLYPSGSDVVYRDGRTNRWGDNATVRLDRDGTWAGSDREGRGERVRVSSRGNGTEAWADLVVRVPTGKTVSLYGVVGDVDATDVDSDLLLDVGTSHVTASNTRGRLRIDAGSGSVEVRGSRGSELNVDTGSGGVTMTDVTSDRCTIDTGSGGVSGTGVACGTLSVDVGSGGVRLTRVRSSDVTIDAGSGSVELAVGTSPRSMQIETGSGGVVLSMPSSIGAELHIESGSGGVSTDFAVKTSRIQRDELRGTIGDGSARIRVTTGSGSVRLLKLVD